MPLRTPTIFLFSALLLLSQPLFGKELEQKTICAWDPIGTKGPVMSFLSDLKAEAFKWGISFDFVRYEEAKDAARDLSTDRCDISVVTGAVSRDLVPFGGTLNAIGGITSEKELQVVLAAITSPKASPLLSHNNFEVVGSMPVGSMYAFVNDRKIRSIDDFKQRRIAVLEEDIQTKMFVTLAGGIPVKETLASIGPSFNDRYVDVALMPALAYELLELHKGMGDRGGVMDLRLFYGMLIAVAKKSGFSEDFGAKMREYIYSRLKNVMTMIENAEMAIPSYYWIRTPAQSKANLESFYKDIRLVLKISDHLDHRALSFLWKIRCGVSPQREECELP